LFSAAPAAVVRDDTMLPISSPEPIPVDVTKLPPAAVADVNELDGVTVDVVLEGITELMGGYILAGAA
jgi:hypothetical protein